jgi:hypothetical protein
MDDVPSCGQENLPGILDPEYVTFVPFAKTAANSFFTES